jgi:hypothetical protein
MKIYFCHTKKFDYKNELYFPIRNSLLNKKNEIIFPHETEKFINSKEIIKGCDLVIAEVSFQSTAMGIELGWANFMNKKIVCVYKKACKIFQSLETVSSVFLEYKNSKDLINKLNIKYV